jgi:peptidase S41-like protein/tricorn protease-like protein
MKLMALILICLSLALPVNGQKGPRAQLPAGSWLSDGYGLYFELDATGLRVYELTSISCTFSQTRPPDNAHTTDSTFAFLSGNSITTLSRTDDPNILRLHMDWAASDIILHRTDKPPETCKSKPPNSPQENYAIFWQTFAEQYAFFTLRKVDWHAVDQKFRPTVTESTSPTDLFQIFRQMIEPLQDTHTSIEARDSKAEFTGWRQDSGHLTDADWNKAASIIKTKYVQGNLRPYCNGRLQFGMLRHSLGYLRVTTFYDYADGSYADELRCLQQSLTSMFESARKLSGLVIDVRLNHGGDDPLGVEIASRLTGNRYLAYTKAARNSSSLDAPLHFTERQPVWVEPVTASGFKGKVALLIGPDTVSAGETFAMALMGREPHVLRIGLDTQGVFSDVLHRSLPNGWYFELPNEVYYTKGGKAFDAIGVPPDIAVSFFTVGDLKASRDAALEEAIRQLTN